METLKRMRNRKNGIEKNRRNSEYENCKRYDCTEVERSVSNRSNSHLTQSLEKYFYDFNQAVPSSYAEASTQLPFYLENSIMEVFYQLDINGTRKVSMKDFMLFCEILDIQIACGDKQPFWQLSVNRKKLFLNAAEFKICLLEQWGAKHSREIGNDKDLNISECPRKKKVYKKLNRTSSLIVNDKVIKNSMLKDYNKETAKKLQCESNETKMMKEIDVVEDKFTEQQLETKVLNQLMNEIGDMLHESNTSQVSVKVVLKKETTRRLTNVTESNLEDVALEKLIGNLNKSPNLSNTNTKIDPFDQELKDLIKQLEEEYNDSLAIEDKTKESIWKENNAEAKSNQGSQEKQMQVLKQRCLKGEMDLPKKGINSEVAKNKTKTSNTFQDLNRAIGEMNLLR